jgi:hypothetical protein
VYHHHTKKYKKKKIKIKKKKMDRPLGGAPSARLTRKRNFTNQSSAQQQRARAAGYRNTSARLTPYALSVAAAAAAAAEVKAEAEENKAIKTVEDVPLPPKSEWGPRFWYTMDRGPQMLEFLEVSEAPEQVMEVERKRQFMFYMGIASLIPCWECRENYLATLDEQKPDVSSSASLKAWLDWVKAKTVEHIKAKEEAEAMQQANGDDADADVDADDDTDADADADADANTDADADADNHNMMDRAQYRRHDNYAEYGDYVVDGGEERRGSKYTDEQQRRKNEWLRSLGPRERRQAMLRLQMSDFHAATTTAPQSTKNGGRGGAWKPKCKSC